MSPVGNRARSLEVDHDYDSGMDYDPCFDDHTAFPAGSFAVQRSYDVFTLMVEQDDSTIAQPVGVDLDHSSLPQPVGAPLATVPLNGLMV